MDVIVTLVPLQQKDLGGSI